MSSGSVQRTPSAADGDFDLGQVVLESDPPRRLTYTWQNYQWRWADMFGWTEEVFAELVKERVSKVTFDLEPMGSVVKLTVVHDGFEGETEVLRTIRQGWPQILSNLKTMLERGQTLTFAGTPAGQSDAEAG